MYIPFFFALNFEFARKNIYTHNAQMNANLAQNIGAWYEIIARIDNPYDLESLGSASHIFRTPILNFSIIEQFARLWKTPVFGESTHTRDRAVMPALRWAIQSCTINNCRAVDLLQLIMGDRDYWSNLRASDWSTRCEKYIGTRELEELRDLTLIFPNKDIVRAMLDLIPNCTLYDDNMAPRDDTEAGHPIWIIPHMHRGVHEVLFARYVLIRLRKIHASTWDQALWRNIWLHNRDSKSERALREVAQLYCVEPEFNARLEQHLTIAHDGIVAHDEHEYGSAFVRAIMNEGQFACISDTICGFHKDLTLRIIVQYGSREIVCGIARALDREIRHRREYYEFCRKCGNYVDPNWDRYARIFYEYVERRAILNMRELL